MSDFNKRRKREREGMTTQSGSPVCGETDATLAMRVCVEFFLTILADFLSTCETFWFHRNLQANGFL